MQVNKQFFSENFSTYVASEQAIVVCALVGPFLRPQESTRAQLSNASQREVFKKFSARTSGKPLPDSSQIFPRAEERVCCSANEGEPV